MVAGSYPGRRLVEALFLVAPIMLSFVLTGLVVQRHRGLP